MLIDRCRLGYRLSGLSGRRFKAATQRRELCRGHWDRL